MMNTVTFPSHGLLAAPIRRQRGVVLIVSLILLMVLTLIGVTAMQTSTLEERMAGNALDKALAFQAAEAALRAGENLLTEDMAELRKSQGWLGKIDYSTNLPEEPWEWDMAKIEDEWAKFDNETFLKDTRVFRPPYYAVQLMGLGVSGSLVSTGDEAVPEGNVFRVTAIGWGATEGAQVIVQSFFLQE